MFEIQVNAQCLIVPKITQDLPSREIKREELNIPANLYLADSEFNKRSSIDLLIGVEFFYELLESGKIDLGENKSFLQNTKLGWVVAGPILKYDGNNINTSHTINILHCSFAENERLDNTLKQFWEIENFAENSKPAWSVEEIECEEKYIDTTRRNEQGRFIVNLPIKSDITCIGEIRGTAFKRLS